MASLSKQYMINSLLDKHYSKKAKSHHMTTAHLTPKKCLKIKSSIMDTKNHLKKVFPFFDSLNKKFL